MSLWFDPRTSRSQMFLKIGVLKNFVTFTGKQLELASELEFDLRDTVDWGNKWFVDFNAGKTGLITMVLLMERWMGLLLRKNHHLRCWG